MTQYWLGLDCGGSWLKAGLYDREGREAGVQRLPLCALSPQPGWAERDMAELWQCCMAVIRALLTHSGVSGEQIVGIGISAQGKGLFLLDKNDNRSGMLFCPRTAGRGNRSSLAGRWHPGKTLPADPTKPCGPGIRCRCYAG